MKKFFEEHKTLAYALIFVLGMVTYFVCSYLVRVVKIFG